MRNNDEFNDRHISPNLEEYLTNEVTQYYGEDIIKKAGESAKATPAARRASGGLLTALVVFCAIMFISGAMLFSGMLLTANHSGGNSTAPQNSSVTASHFNTDTESDTEQKTADTTSTYNQPSSKASSDSSSASDKSNTDTESDTEQKTSDTTSTYNQPSSKASFDSSSASEKNNTDTESNTEQKTSDTTSTYSEPSSIESSDSVVQNESQILYFSMPEYPDEGTVSIPDTDIFNTPETNPYDNVTTGNKAHAWFGVLLMSLSLISAIAISKYKFDNDC